MTTQFSGTSTWSLMRTGEINLGFTGTRKPITDAQRRWLWEFFDDYDIHELHHGCCINADEESHLAALSIGGISVYVHPPVNQAFLSTVCLKKHPMVHVLPARDFRDRNHDIVESTNQLIAMPNSVEHLISGTWSTVRYARRLHKTVAICYPDGSYVIENNQPTRRKS